MQTQIDILQRWIKAGAKWEKHWAFIPPVRSALPSVKNKAWPKNALDHFVLARLEQEGLQPAPEADAASDTLVLAAPNRFVLELVRGAGYDASLSGASLDITV